MAWYNPFSWFRCDPDEYNDRPRFSRRAVDSTDFPMDGNFSPPGPHPCTHADFVGIYRRIKDESAGLRARKRWIY